MADYTLGYSGQQIDNVCNNVLNGALKDISKIRVKWEVFSTENEVKANTTHSFPYTFENILPEGAENRNDICIIVSCDFGGECFDIASTAFERNGRNVTVRCLVDAADIPWPGGHANELGKYNMTCYCLVIYQDGDGGGNGNG